MSEEAEFNPGIVVLAKMKGYPAWPGIIVEESLMDSTVVKNKPKSDDRFPVRFLNDSTFMWANKAELKPLSQSDAKAFLTKGSRASKALIGAYEVAASETIDHKKMAKVEPPAPKKSQKVPSSKKATADESAAATPAKKEKKPAVTPTTSGSKNSSTPSKRKTTATAKSEEPSAKKQKPAAAAPKPAADRQEVVQNARLVLQRGFLGRKPPSADDIQKFSDVFTDLENIKDLELSIIRKTKINKVLRAIVKLDPNTIPKENEFKIIERSHQLLNNWIKEAEGNETPKPEAADSKVDVDAKEEVSTADNKTDSTEEQQENEDGKKKEDDKNDEEENDGEQKNGEKKEFETKGDEAAGSEEKEGATENGSKSEGA